MASDTEFCLLGPVTVRAGGATVPVPAGKQRAVLAALLLNANLLVSLDELADVLWADDPPPSAQVVIRNYVMRLRKTLGPAAGSRISTEPRGYLIRVNHGELDLARFQAHLNGVRAAVRDSAWQTIASRARAGLALWRGEPLADVESELLAKRDVPRLGEQRLEALEARIRADLQLGQHAAVVTELRQLTATYPVRENLHGLLMLALYRDGRQAEALGVYQDARKVLIETLGIGPGTGLRDLHQQILTADPALVGTGPPHPVELGLAAAELRCEAELACGRSARLIPELRRLTGEHPLRERLWLLLIRALREAGRHAEAMEAYAQVQQVISDELGVDPGPELRQLYEELLAADGASAPQKRPPLAEVTANIPTAAAPSPATPVPRTEQPDRDETPTAGTDEGTDAMSDEAHTAIANSSSSETAATPGMPEPGAMPLPRPGQLPADIGDFTGREVHVRRLCAVLVNDKDGDNPGAVRIAVVAGTGGLGKTTLAVHAAHQVRGSFPDGQLYVDLLGSSSHPAAPGEVLARFLRDLGVDGAKIPAGDDERAALYRTSLTGRRVLVLLDNARDAAQIRPLLPGSASCAVLVTTRSRIPDLARPRYVDLDVLEDAEALQLFSRIVGDDRPAQEPDATAEVLAVCAGLPLAIRICAARLAVRGQWKVATVASRLRDERRRLDELEAGDLAVRASFKVSYDSLPAGRRGIDPARAFRLLGLWQGESISLPAAAALVGEPQDDVADALEALVDANLLESPAPEWYRFHDLLRFYATERAQAEESEADRGDAVGRLLRWYLATAEQAANMVAPRRYQVPREPAEEEWPPLEFATVQAALAWYEEERANVVAATRQAASAGVHDVAWRLPPTLSPVFNRRSNWADHVVTHRMAAESVQKTGESLGEAWVLQQLGWGLARLGEEEAFGHLRQALAIRQELGDAKGEAQTVISLGEVHLRVHGPGAAAREYLQHAADLLEAMDQPSLRATALNNLGDVHFGLGNLDAAAEQYAQARDIFVAIGAYGAGIAYMNLGRVYLSLHRLDDAVASLKEALRLDRAAGDLFGEATAFMLLGQAHGEAGNVAEARESWTEAMAIFEHIDEPAQAAEVAASLASLPS